MFGYRVPDPDEVMLISGGRKSAEDVPFSIERQAKFVIPGFRRKVRFLGMGQMQSKLDEGCTTTQGLQCNVKSVIAFKIAPDDASIYAAGQRFLDDQKVGRDGQTAMSQQTGQIFAGHLRAIVGAMTLEDIIQKRQMLNTEVLDASKAEMANMGLWVDSFQITHIDDCGTGYIEAMAAPHNAAIQQKAKVAQAAADQAAAEAQQNSLRKQAEFNRETQMLQAKYKADTDKAEAEAAQAGPLAQAQAQQQVLTMKSELAQRNADLRQRELVTEIEKPAEAEAKRIGIMANADATRAEAQARQLKTSSEAQAASDVVMAEAAAKQVRLAGQAEADRVRAVGLAQAESQRASADAMAANDRAQLEQARINVMPEVARAIASGLSSSNLTILNGAEGLSALTASVLQQGRAIFDSFGNNGQPSTNGHDTTSVSEGLNELTGSGPVRGGS